ncbi:MAG: pyridoxine 5'-phosphate synthase [Candidatus Omnitrophica bacterium]|nr:pyridoxine 5'-phosphate synthase [Candidatus Omnitrophota bacterium]
MLKLGVNIDHVATLRQARRGYYPDPILAAQICEKAGADSIVCHLREDRRHIQDNDVMQLRKIVRTRLNLEMSLNPEIIKITGHIKPDIATIVPERRQEITTEGGLDVIKYFTKIKNTVSFLQDKHIAVSLFIAPVKEQIDQAKKSGATIIELHTGAYADARTTLANARELKKILIATQYAKQIGLTVSAGHGLNYENTSVIAQISDIQELNIGHSIISESIYIGLESAVKKMLNLMKIKK